MDAGKHPVTHIAHAGRYVKIFTEVKFMNKVDNKINQIENAQKLSAVINAFYSSWDQLEKEDIETLMHMASEYADAIKTHLTEMAEGKK
ncbi:hypothetical protein HNE31_000446 [Salmonella enterica]|nr:hypothetical protein [Salmonella enterica]